MCLSPYGHYAILVPQPESSKQGHLAEKLQIILDGKLVMYPTVLLFVPKDQNAKLEQDNISKYWKYADIALSSSREFAVLEHSDRQRSQAHSALPRPTSQENTPASSKLSTPGNDYNYEASSSEIQVNHNSGSPGFEDLPSDFASPSVHTSINMSLKVDGVDDEDFEFFCTPKPASVISSPQPVNVFQAKAFPAAETHSTFVFPPAGHQISLESPANCASPGKGFEFGSPYSCVPNTGSISSNLMFEMSPGNLSASPGAFETGLPNALIYKFEGQLMQTCITGSELEDAIFTVPARWLPFKFEMEMEMEEYIRLCPGGIWYYSPGSKSLLDISNKQRVMHIDSQLSMEKDLMEDAQPVMIHAITDEELFFLKPGKGCERVKDASESFFRINWSEWNANDGTYLAFTNAIDQLYNLNICNMKARYDDYADRRKFPRSFVHVQNVAALTELVFRKKSDILSIQALYSMNGT